MNHNEDKSTNPPENDDVSDNETQNDVPNETVNDALNEEQDAKEQTTQQPPINEQQDTNNTDDVNAEKTWHNKNALKRGIAMLGFGFIAGFVRLGITLIAVFQFFSLLFAERPNLPLVKFGQNLNTFLYQINQFLTVNSEMYPFPFADWPDSAPKE